jgi:hypothetical protein
MVRLKTARNLHHSATNPQFENGRSNNQLLFMDNFILWIDFVEERFESFRQVNGMHL